MPGSNYNETNKQPVVSNAGGNIQYVGDIECSGNFVNVGDVGLSATYTFGGGTTGDITTMTFKGGILTGVTTVP